MSRRGFYSYLKSFKAVYESKLLFIIISNFLFVHLIDDEAVQFFMALYIRYCKVKRISNLCIMLVKFRRPPSIMA